MAYSVMKSLMYLNSNIKSTKIAFLKYPKKCYYSLRMSEINLLTWNHQTKIATSTTSK